MNVSSSQPRTSTPIDATSSSGPTESLTSEPPPSAPGATDLVCNDAAPVQVADR